MGKIDMETARKCVIGIADSFVHGKPLSDDTKRSCAEVGRQAGEANDASNNAARENKNTEPNSSADQKAKAQFQKDFYEKHNRSDLLMQLIQPKMREVRMIQTQFSQQPSSPQPKINGEELVMKLFTGQSQSI